QHTGLVTEDDRVKPLPAGDDLDVGLVVVVGVDRGVGEHDLGRDPQPGVAGDTHHPGQLVEVEQAVEDPQAVDAMAGQGLDPQFDDAARGDAHADHTVAAGPGPQQRVRHGRPHEVEALPGVLSAIADEDLEDRATGAVDDPVTDGVDLGRDRQDVSGPHAHAPQALLPVAERLIDDLHGGQGQSP